ncbi:acyltransferase family protein [Nonomuraea dietziae]|uniref:acyltransferase family protein n=1 Tax=Nonomuraea dietziae TaxID=65515 RepID=UPI0036120C81
MSTTLETAPRATVFVDRLRVVLIAQVVLHHVALTYGSFPLWYYHEPTMRGPGLPAGSAWPLDLLLLLNQTYFMGLFFLLSACFVPASLERKGGARFLLDRLRRLGLPMLAGYFLIVPLAKIPKYLWLNEREPVPFGAFYLDELEMGPFWFLATLLAFTLAYAGFRALRGQAPPPVSSAPRARTIVGFGAVLAAAGVLWRIWEPIERVPVLEVAAPAYLPQYVCMFVAGLAVHRRGWLTALPASAAGWGFGTALAGALLLLPVIVVTMGDGRAAPAPAPRARPVRRRVLHRDDGRPAVAVPPQIRRGAAYGLPDLERLRRLRRPRARARRRLGGAGRPARRPGRQVRRRLGRRAARLLGPGPSAPQGASPPRDPVITGGYDKGSWTAPQRATEHERMQRLRPALCALVLLLSACSTAPPVASTAPTSAPATSPPVASTPATPVPTTTGAAGGVPADHRALVDRFVAAINAGDAGQVAETFTQDARFDSVGRIYDGRTQIMERFLVPEVIEAGGAYTLRGVSAGAGGRVIAEYDFATGHGGSEHFTYDCAVEGARFADCVGRYVG